MVDQGGPRDQSCDSPSLTGVRRTAFVHAQGLDPPRNMASLKQLWDRYWRSRGGFPRLRHWPLKSGVKDFRHAEQAQEPALQSAQLGRKDHGGAPPDSERVTLHVVE